MASKIDLKGKVALVIISDYIIGLPIISELINAGCKIYCIALNKETFDQAYLLKNKNSKRFKGVHLGDGDIFNREEGVDDIFSLKKVDYLFDELEKKEGKLDILICNIGSPRYKAMKDITIEDWNIDLISHLAPLLLYCQKSLEIMRKQRSGVIVNTSSILGARIGGEGILPYATISAAKIGFMRSIIKEYAGSGIRMNTVCLGYIYDDEIEKRMTVEERKSKEIIQMTVPLKRLGKPEEIAKSIVSLASDNASYINGAIITIDGGFSVL